MASRESICYNVLKKHGLMINYSGKSRKKVDTTSRKWETFGQWTKRVLGSKIKNVIVYGPVKTTSRTRISTLQKKSGGEHIKNIFEAYGQFKNEKETEAVAAVEERHLKIPKDALRKVLSAFDGPMEESLDEFFSRFLSGTSDDVDMANLLKELLKGYNSAVRSFRELEARNASKSAVSPPLLSDGPAA